jgi:hypothetical protein
MTRAATPTGRASRSRPSRLDLTSQSRIKFVRSRPIEEHAGLRDVLALTQRKRFAATESEQDRRSNEQGKGDS